MQPKKKSMVVPILYGLCLILILYLMLHGAVANKVVTQMIEAGELAENQKLGAFFDQLAIRLAEKPFSFKFNEYTQDWLTYGLIGWVLVIAGINSNKKNYIHGKEFGTSKWGTLADIKDLFACNLEAEEIKRTKQTRTSLGRWKVRRNLYGQCEKDGQAIQNAKLEQLKEEAEKLKRDGKFDKGLHQEAMEKIKKEVKETVTLAKRQAWYPDQAKVDYESVLQEIEESYSKGMLSDEVRETKKRGAKEDYEKKLQAFYKSESRIAKIKAKYKDADMLFTKTERISFFNWKLNQNILILGGSGSGKTRGFVMPNILQAHSSYIITDPKGEILEKAGFFLSEMKGYKIRVLNLDEKTLSDGYNPFVYIHPDRPGYEERVLSLIEAIIINTDGGEKKGGSDPFWDKAERLFLQAVFFFTTDGFVPEERNMNTVLSLIKMLEIGEEEDNMDSDLDMFVKIFAENYGEDHIGVEQYREFRSKASGKTAKSIVISAVARLAPFRTSEVKRIFSYDSMQLDRVGEEKTAVFVVVPPTDTTFNFVAGMLFTQLFQELQYCATQVHKHEGQRLPVPCRFILDEFANTCTIPNFVKILAYARSFGIGIVPILQSLEQIKNMYKDEWGVIIDNCNSLLYLGSITHMDTLEYMSKLLGKGTFDKRTTGLSKGSHGSSSQNFDVVGRELMDSAEIRKLPKEKCLLVVGGRNPFYSDKYEYKDHPNYRFTSDANKEYSFDIESYRKKQTEKNDNHGEDAKDKEKKAEKPQPSEAAKVESDPIPVEPASPKLLNQLVKDASDLEPISDEEMIVPNGENTEEKYSQMLLAALVGEEEAARENAKLTTSAETKAYLDNLKNDRIEVEVSLVKAVARLGRTFRELEPIPDEEMIVPNGESTEKLDQNLLQYFEEEENEVSPEELQYAIEGSVEEMMSLINELGIDDFDEEEPDM